MAVTQLNRNALLAQNEIVVIDPHFLRENGIEFEIDLDKEVWYGLKRAAETSEDVEADLIEFENVMIEFLKRLKRALQINAELINTLGAYAISFLAYGREDEAVDDAMVYVYLKPYSDKTVKRFLICDYYESLIEYEE